MGNWLADIVKWKPFYIASVVFVVLILITYFFFPTLSVVLFLALVGFWSRVPAMFNRAVKDLEMIDFLSVVIAINLGAFAGAFFAGGLLVFSHFFTRTEYPRYAIMDGLAMFIAALATPLIYSYLGQNLLFTMYAYTIVRYIIRGIFALTVFPGELPGLIPIIACGIGLAYLTNTVYVFAFGNFMNQLFVKGLHIHWGFFAVAIGILGFIGSKKWLGEKMTEFNKTKVKND